LSPAFAPPAQAADGNRYDAIPNGQLWLDTDGDDIQAHGGGFLKVDDTYYWVGEDKSHNSAVFGGVNLYSSTDLENWTNHGQILTVDSTDAAGNRPLAHAKLERPKLLYNAPTDKYVLWGHYETSGSYSASEVLVATADTVDGPYTVDEKGHFRPGAGNEAAAAMGDRIGQLTEDFDTSARNAANTAHPYAPVQADYPPKILQYNDPNSSNPENLTYVGDGDYGTSMTDNWWTFNLNDIAHNVTLKARAVAMTPFDRSAYDAYQADYNVSTKKYIVRQPTEVRSEVVAKDYVIGSPGDERAELVAPVIHPTLAESTSDEAVYVKAKDRVFITGNTDGAEIYYTTDGSDPADADNTNRHGYVSTWTSTNISIQGTAGQRTTVKAVAIKNGEASAVSETVYEIAADPSTVPLFNPVVNYESGTYTGFGYKSLRIFSPTYGAEVYYTVDGKDPDPALPGENIGFGSRDFTVYQDEKTGEAYLVTAEDHIYMRVWKLTDDFTDVVPELEYDMYVAGHREAPALIRSGGATGQYVYLVTSSQSGWYPNQAQYGRTENLDLGFENARDEYGYRDGQSTWSPLQLIGDNTTYGSQPTRLLNVGTDADPEYVYMGDRWRPDLLMKSTYVWLPLEIDDQGNDGKGLMKLEFVPKLDLDVANGTINREEGEELLSLDKPVSASPQISTALGGPTEAIEDWETTPEQEAELGWFRHYNAELANDGKDWDVDLYDNTEEFYRAGALPYHWQVDLGAPSDLSWLGISFKTVSGSDNVHRYIVNGSLDGTRWTEIADNSQNMRIGYQDHLVSGRYRYVRIDVYDSFDLAHGRSGATWATGIYEVSVHGREVSPVADLVEASAVTRCVAGKAQVAVRAENISDEPIDIELTTDFGAKSFTGIAPEVSAYQAFATRASSVDAGEARVNVGGESLALPYEAVSCG